MKLGTWSDVVCPWSYVAKRHAEAALSHFTHADEVSVEVGFDPAESEATLAGDACASDVRRVESLPIHIVNADRDGAACADGTCTI
jgi:predicted DsbA family dithiol-disulfide isomerase